LYFIVEHGSGGLYIIIKGIGCVFVTKAAEFGFDDEVGFSSRIEIPLPLLPRPSLRNVCYPFEAAGLSRNFPISFVIFILASCLFLTHLTHLAAFILLLLIIFFLLYLLFSSYLLSSFPYLFPFRFLKHVLLVNPNCVCRPPL
jgi:hypothetical protein